MSADSNQSSTLNHSPPTLSESLAIEKARGAVASYGERNPKLIQAQLLVYQQALLQLPEPIIPTDDDERMNGLVWLVEMSGRFKPRSYPPAIEKNPLLAPKNKAYVILGATDGVPFLYQLWAE